MGRMKYLKQLTEEEWIKMHVEVFGLWYMTFKHCDFDYDGWDGFHLRFYANDGKDDIQLLFHYHEFTRPQPINYHTYEVRNVESRYLKYMAAKFGQEYINDYFEWTTAPK